MLASLLHHILPPPRHILPPPPPPHACTVAGVLVGVVTCRLRDLIIERRPRPRSHAYDIFFIDQIDVIGSQHIWCQNG
jgi:hypothetical protein